MDLKVTTGVGFMAWRGRRKHRTTECHECGKKITSHSQDGNLSYIYRIMVYDLDIEYSNRNVYRGEKDFCSLNCANKHKKSIEVRKAIREHRNKLVQEAL